MSSTSGLRSRAGARRTVLEEPAPAFSTAQAEEIALLTKDLRENPERYLKDIKISVF